MGDGGIIRGAIKLLISDDTVAVNNSDILENLKDKHPVASRDLPFQSPIDVYSIYVTQQKKTFLRLLIIPEKAWHPVWECLLEKIMKMLVNILFLCKR